jgi:putative oxidoreductase
MKTTNQELIALALFRVLTGALAFTHGLRKLIQGPVSAIGKAMSEHGFPPSFAYVVTVGELAGLLLAIGLFTRLAAAGVAATMLGIAVVVQSGLIPQIGTGRGVPFEYPLLLAVAAALFVVLPRTPLSLDARRRR